MFEKFFDPQALLVTWPVFLFSLSFHEFFHAWSADRLGDPTARHMGRLTMNPLAHYDPIGTTLGMVFRTFGWAKPVPVNSAVFRWPKRDMMLTALAGPASNVLLAVVFGIAFKAVQPHVSAAHSPGSIAVLIEKMAAYGVVLNLALALFNLIPIPPLDGHHILRGFLSFHAALRYDGMERYSVYLLIPVVMWGGRLVGPVIFLVLSLVFSGAERYQIGVIWNSVLP